MSAIPTLTVQELQQRRQAGSQHLLLDVREAHELAICAVAGHVHIPLGQLAQRLNELPKDQPIVAMCHHGGRSARATELLRAAGYDAVNLAGGIDHWAMQIEPTMARY